jgi:hypothetical protein
MATTLSRARERRGVRSRLRVREPDDSTAPKRRRLKASGTVADLLTRPRKRRARVETVTKDERRRRPRAGGIGVPEPGRDGLGSALANTTVAPRNRSRAPGARTPSREASKLARIRDGRYARGRSRFVV